MDKIVQIILKDCQDKYGIDLRSDNKAMKRITDAAMEAERFLAHSKKCEISLPFLGVYKTQDELTPFHYFKEINQSEI